MRQNESDKIWEKRLREEEIRQRRAGLGEREEKIAVYEN